MIFQEPMTSLSPLHTIGDQVGEMLLLHANVGHKEARRAATEMFRLVGFPDPRLPTTSTLRAFRRPSAAGDDRHGAHLSAGTADCR